MLFFKFQLQVAAFCDLYRMGDRLGDVLKKIGHLLGRLDIEFIRWKLHPIGLLKCLPRLNAEENLVGFGILAL